MNFLPARVSQYQLQRRRYPGDSARETPCWHSPALRGFPELSGSFFRRPSAGVFFARLSSQVGKCFDDSGGRLRTHQGGNPLALRVNHQGCRQDLWRFYAQARGGVSG